MITGLKKSSVAYNVYFTDQNIMQRGNPMKMNFEVLELEKLKYSNG